jgi:hypothetical protein
MDKRIMLVDQTNRHLVSYMGLVPCKKKESFTQLFTFNSNPFVVTDEVVAHKIAVNAFNDLTIIEYTCEITGAKFYILDSFTLN